MTWSEVEEAISDLSSKISERPDVIVAVVRGGLIPGRLLAKQLGVKDMYALTVRKDGLSQVVSTRIEVTLTGRNVLLVEDVLESGASIAAVKHYLESLGAKVATAALYIQPDSEIKPDFYLAVSKEVPIFPWD